MSGMPPPNGPGSGWTRFMGPPRETEITRQQRRRRGEVRITVVLRPGEPPHIKATKGIRWQDLIDAKRALFDACMNRGKFRNPNEGAKHEWEQRKQWEVRSRAKEAVYNQEHPWLCEFCDRRFKTEHGCKVHEHHCRKRNEPSEPLPFLDADSESGATP